MTATNPFDWCRRNRSLAIAGSAVLAIALLASVPVGAQTEQDVDLQAYCRAKHPNSFPERIGFEHFCQEPGASGGATRHNIDLAEACRLTTGSESYRRMGPRVICAANIAEAPGQAAATTSGPPDFQVYCREMFPNSAYERRAEPWAVMHYCRRPGATGGFTLQPIDLADACERTFSTRQYKGSGDAVTCGGSGETASNDAPNRPGPGPAPRRRPRPDPDPGPEPGPFPEPGPEVKPLPEPLPPPGEPREPDVASTEQEGPDMGLACQAIGGQWRSGTLPLVDNIVSKLQRELAEIYAGCDGGQYVEQCRRHAKNNWSADAYFEVLMIWQCHASLVRKPPPEVELDDIRLARDEGCAIEETLSKLQVDLNSAGGTMQVAPHKTVLENFELDDLCAKGEIRFVRDPSVGGATFDGETLPYSEPVFVEVEFDRAMKKSSRRLELKTGSDAATIEVFQVSPQLYRSKEPVILEMADDGVVSP